VVRRRWHALHMRVEDDMITNSALVGKGGDPLESYDNTMRRGMVVRCVSELRRNGVTRGDVVYLATGASDRAKSLLHHDLVQRMGLTLVTKDDILSRIYRQKRHDHPLILFDFNGLSPEEKALIDYQVCQSSDIFIGDSRSSFTISILAQRRNTTTITTAGAGNDAGAGVSADGGGDGGDSVRTYRDGDMYGGVMSNFRWQDSLLASPQMLAMMGGGVAANYCHQSKRSPSISSSSSSSSSSPSSPSPSLLFGWSDGTVHCRRSLSSQLFTGAVIKYNKWLNDLNQLRGMSTTQLSLPSFHASSVARNALVSFSHAIRSLILEVHTNPHHTDAYTITSMILHEQGAVTAALRWCNRGVERNPLHGSSLIESGSIMASWINLDTVVNQEYRTRYGTTRANHVAQGAGADGGVGDGSYGGAGGTAGDFGGGVDDSGSRGLIDGGGGVERGAVEKILSSSYVEIGDVDDVGDVGDEPWWGGRLGRAKVVKGALTASERRCIQSLVRSGQAILLYPASSTFRAKAAYALEACISTELSTISAMGPPTDHTRDVVREKWTGLWMGFGLDSWDGSHDHDGLSLTPICALPCISPSTSHPSIHNHGTTNHHDKGKHDGCGVCGGCVLPECEASPPSSPTLSSPPSLILTHEKARYDLWRALDETAPSAPSVPSAPSAAPAAAAPGLGGVSEAELGRHLRHASSAVALGLLASTEPINRTIAKSPNLQAGGSPIGTSDMSDGWGWYDGQPVKSGEVDGDGVLYSTYHFHAALQALDHVSVDRALGTNVDGSFNATQLTNERRIAVAQMLSAIREAALNGLGVNLYRQDNIYASLIYLCTNRREDSLSERSQRVMMQTEEAPTSGHGGHGIGVGGRGGRRGGGDGSSELRRANCAIVRGRAQRAIKLRERYHDL